MCLGAPGGERRKRKEGDGTSEKCAERPWRVGSVVSSRLSLVARRRRRRHDAAQIDPSIRSRGGERAPRRRPPIAILVAARERPLQEIRSCHHVPRCTRLPCAIIPFLSLSLSIYIYISLSLSCEAFARRGSLASSAESTSGSYRSGADVIPLKSGARERTSFPFTLDHPEVAQRRLIRRTLVPSSFFLRLDFLLLGRRGREEADPLMFAGDNGSAMDLRSSLSHVLLKSSAPA